MVKEEFGEWVKCNILEIVILILVLVLVINTFLKESITELEEETKGAAMEEIRSEVPEPPLKMESEEWETPTEEGVPEEVVE